jgi:hypothetical protein
MVNVHVASANVPTQHIRGRTKLVKSHDNLLVAMPPPPRGGSRLTNQCGRLKKHDIEVDNNSDDTAKNRCRRKNSDKEEQHNSNMICLRNRKSTLDFLPYTLKQRRRTMTLDRRKIVGTCLSKEDSELLASLCASLRPRLKLSNTVTRETGYVVVGEPVRRTLSLLYGVSQGCWIVSREWLVDSLEQGRWVDEVPYELTDFSPAVSETRREFEAFGPRPPKYGPLAELPPLNFSRLCKAPLADLRKLVQLNGGHAVSTVRNAGLLIGQRQSNGRKSAEEMEDASVRVEEKWFFDSIQHQRVMPVEDYLLA